MEHRARSRTRRLPALPDGTDGWTSVSFGPPSTGHLLPKGRAAVALPRPQPRSWAAAGSSARDPPSPQGRGSAPSKEQRDVDHHPVSSCPLPGPPAVQGTSGSLAGQQAGAQAEGGLGGGQQLLQPPPPWIRARAKGCCWHSCCRGAREHPGPHLPHQGPRVKPKGQGGADRWGRQRDVSPGLPLPLAPTRPCGSIRLRPLAGMGRRGSRSAEGDGGRWAGIPCTKRGNRGAVKEGESARWLPLLVGWKGEGRGCTVPSPSRGSP